MTEEKNSKLLENGDEGKVKTFSFTEKQLGVIQLGLDALIDMIDGKNDASIPKDGDSRKILRGYVEELFASVHSQGG
jgi:hypothetical protein